MRDVAGSPGVRPDASIGSFDRGIDFFRSRTAQPGPWAIRWQGGPSPIPGARRGAGLPRGAGRPAAAGGRGAGRGRRRVFSAGPGGVQVWSEPWNGDGGTSGSSVQLGSVEWTANAPTRSYITIHRCRVTRAGRARGIEPADLLKRVLDLAGLPHAAARANLAAAEPT